MIQAYTDIVQRLTQTTRLKTAKRIREEFDIPLFTQMVEHNAFDGKAMLGLVNTTFDWIKKLQCPKRDEEADAAKKRVMACTNMAEVIPVYIKEVTTCLDYMDADMKEFMQHKDHPVMQETLRRMITKAEV